MAPAFTRAYRQTVVAAAAAPQLKDIDHSDIASKVKRQLLINGKFVDAIGGKVVTLVAPTSIAYPCIGMRSCCCKQKTAV